MLSDKMSAMPHINHEICQCQVITEWISVSHALQHYIMTYPRDSLMFAFSDFY